MVSRFRILRYLIFERVWFDTKTDRQTAHCQERETLPVSFLRLKALWYVKFVFLHQTGKYYHYFQREHKTAIVSHLKSTA